MDILFALPFLPFEHPQPVAVGLCGLVLLLLNRFGALPRFPWRVPAARVTPRTPAQEAADNRRIADIKVAAREIRQQFADDGDGERVRPLLHPIVTFEKERVALSGVQRRIRLEQQAARDPKRNHFTTSQPIED